MGSLSIRLVLKSQLLWLKVFAPGFPFPSGDRTPQKFSDCAQGGLNSCQENDRTNPGVQGNLHGVQVKKGQDGACDVHGEGRGFHHMAADTSWLC